MRSIFRVIIDRDFRDREAAQCVADAINASAHLGGHRAVVIEQGAIGRFPVDIVRRVERIMASCRVPPPSRADGMITKARCELIVRQYGERDGGLFSRHATREERAARSTAAVNHVIGVFFHRRKSQWRRDGHILDPYGFKRTWYAAGFIDGLAANRGND